MKRKAILSSPIVILSVIDIIAVIPMQANRCTLRTQFSLAVFYVHDKKCPHYRAHSANHSVGKALVSIKRPPTCSESFC